MEYGDVDMTSMMFIKKIRMDCSVFVSNWSHGEGSETIHIIAVYQ